MNIQRYALAGALLAIILPTSIAFAAQGGARGSSGASAGVSVGASDGGNAGTGVGGSVGGSAAGTQIQIQDRTQERDMIRDPSTHTGSEPDQTRLQIQDQDRTRLMATTSTSAMPAYSGTQTQMQERAQYRLATPTPSQIATGTPGGDQNAVRSQNRVETAVRAIIAADGALGGIGPQISEIAQRIGDSAATTSAAEAQIRGRGFWSRLFLGGDSQNARVIEQEVERNRSRIQEMTSLLGQASVSPDVRARLTAQIQEIEQEQIRLQSLAQAEIGSWGLLSWRF